MESVVGLGIPPSGHSSTSTHCPILVRPGELTRAALTLTNYMEKSDPSDIAALDENPIAAKDVKVDESVEAQRPEFKRQAQEWAGIKQDPNSNLFVFVGRWSKQKGNDHSPPRDMSFMLTSLNRRRSDCRCPPVFAIQA